MLFYALSNFESQISSYKQDKAVRILSFVNEARVLFLFTYVLNRYNFQSNVAFFNFDKSIYEHIESAFIVYPKYFAK